MVAQRSLQPDLLDDEEPDPSLGLALTGHLQRTFYQRYGKRALDLALGVPLALVATLVILGLAVLVVATSGWPPFYRARRVGRGGREFSMIKLRTMVRDADRALAVWREQNPELAREYERNFKLKDDPRVTPLGRFLRRSSLDELPQLWNVVKGDMSLVGPRPVVEDELHFYRRGKQELLSVRPGMTGLWAINGRSDLEYPRRTWFELSYCRSVTLAQDVRILFHTLGTVARFNGQ